MQLWNRVNLIRNYFSIVKDPTQTERIFDSIDRLTKDKNQEPVVALEKRIMSKPNFQAMYEDRYIPEIPKKDDLKKMPEGSLGRAFFEHLDKNNLNVEYFPRIEMNRPAEYLSQRIYLDHDLWHAVLGYGVSVEDELALQAFGVAQFESPIGLLIISGGILHIIKNRPTKAVEGFNHLVEGYLIGKKAQFFLGEKIYERLEEPLEKVRKDLNVELNHGQ